MSVIENDEELQAKLRRVSLCLRAVFVMYLILYALVFYITLIDSKEEDRVKSFQVAFTLSTMG